jgi:hypothetical protein
VRGANDGFRFLLELAVLVSLAYWGWGTANGPAGWLLAIGLPIAVAVVWVTWVNPNSSRVLHDPWRLLLEVAIFGSAVAALGGTGRTAWAIVFAVLAALHLALTFPLDQRHAAADQAKAPVPAPNRTEAS